MCIGGGDIIEGGDIIGGGDIMGAGEMGGGISPRARASAASK